MTGAARRGFTLIEIVVAMTLTLAVFAITLPFVRSQTRALGASAGRLDADQIARYAQRAIDRDLRLASAVSGQPLLVLAAPFAIAFNANLFATDTTDPGAADIESGGAVSLTESWAVADAATLPLVVRSYPPAAYTDADGATSHSETISYFLHPDTITGRSDIYVLYRRVNARDSVQIVRGLYVPADSSFFNYQRPIGGTLTRIAESRLPLYWDSVAVDSIRAVGIRAAGHYRDRYTGAETIRTVQWTSVLPNAANRITPTCGSAPGAPSGQTATKQAPNFSGGGPPTDPLALYGVVVVWTKSADDAAGGDVRHYVVARRISGSGSAWETLASVPAVNRNSNQWTHPLPFTTTGTFEYAVWAVDCGGTTSSVVTTATVTLP